MLCCRRSVGAGQADHQAPAAWPSQCEKWASSTTPVQSCAGYDYPNYCLCAPPVPERSWPYTQSIGMIQEIMGPDAMVPMTLEGLSRGMKELTR